MRFLRYLLLLLKIAFRHSVGHAQTVLFVAFVAVGAATWLLKPHFPLLAAMIPDVTGWQIAALVLAAIILVRLILAPYWIYKDQAETIKTLERKITSAFPDKSRETSRASLPANEKSRLSNVISGLFDLFQQASEIGNAAKEFVGRIKSCSLSIQRTQIDDLTQRAGLLYQSIFREYPEKHRYYNRDISNIIQNDGPFHTLLDAMYDYMWTIDRLTDTPQSSAMMILETHGKYITKANRDVSAWIAEAFKRIDAIRAEISS